MTCPHCKARFRKTHARQKYCERACQNCAKTRRWQFKQARYGLCIICGAGDVFKYSRCKRCTIQYLECRERRKANA